MAKTDAGSQPASAKPRALPLHIILLAGYSEYQAGKVLAANAELVATLDAEGVTYRAATDFERRIGGFPD